MKRFFGFVFGTLILVMMSVIAFAETAYVISTRTNVRAEPRTNAKKLATVENGQKFTVLGDTQYAGDTWYIVQLSSIGLSDYDEAGQPVYGFVRAGFCQLGEKMYIMANSAIIYSSPSRQKRIGQAPDHEAEYLVIEDLGDVYCVSLVEGRAGVGFIDKGDVDGYPYTKEDGAYVPTYGTNPGTEEWYGSSQYQAPQQTTQTMSVSEGTQVVLKDTRVYADASLRTQIGILSSGYIATVLNRTGSSVGIAYNYSGVNIVGYVPTNAIQ